MCFKLLVLFYVARLSLRRKCLGSSRLIARYKFNDISNYALTLIGRKGLKLYVKMKEVATTVAFEQAETVLHTFFESFDIGDLIITEQKVFDLQSGMIRV